MNVETIVRRANVARINGSASRRLRVAALAATAALGLATASTDAVAATAHRGHTAGLQSLSFVANGQSVAYLKQGTGTPLIIVHGLGGHKEDFKSVIEQLASDHTVYAFDMLGFGQSSRTAPSVGPGAQAEVIAALIRHERLRKAHVLGNSAGAWAAATFAAKYPSLIDRLILSDAAGLAVTMKGPPPVKFAPDTVAEMQTLLRTVIASDFAHTTEFATRALAEFKASGEAATLAQLFAEFGKSDGTDRLLDDVLPEIKAPTLVVWGALDGLFPPALADRVVAGIPGARKVLIPGASHFPQIDNPTALSEAIAEFIR